MKNIKFLILGLILVLSLPSFSAIDMSTMELEDNFSVSSNEDPQGWWLYFGSHPGEVKVKSSTFGEPNRDGHNMNFKLLGSYYTQDRLWALDAGLGFQGVSVEGGGSDVDANAFFIDAAARYRLPNYSRVQIGPAVNVLLSGDTRYNGDSQSIATFVGVAGDYELPIFEAWNLRLGARLFTDINISGRRVNQYLLDFQIGIPYNYQQPLAEVAPVEEFVEPRPVVRIELDKINYSKIKVIPSQKDQQFLERLGQRLFENKELFEGIRINARAGAEGKKTSTNQIVSHSRGRHVLKWLAQGGYPVERLEVSSRSRNIKDAKKAAQARFVELEFTGVKDEEAIRSLIQDVR